MNIRLRIQYFLQSADWKLRGQRADKFYGADSPGRPWTVYDGCGNYCDLMLGNNKKYKRSKKLIREWNIE